MLYMRLRQTKDPPCYRMFLHIRNGERVTKVGISLAIKVPLPRPLEEILCTKALPNQDILFVFPLLLLLVLQKVKRTVRPR